MSAPAPSAKGPMAWRIARRELRGGLKGFRIFLACLALGVGTIAGVGSLSDALLAGLERDGKSLLGGEVELRLIHREASAEEEGWLKENSARFSRTSELRTMARHEDRRRLVELKAVDDAYPLYGQVGLTGAQDLEAALARREGQWGAAIDAAVVNTIGAELGETLNIGGLDYQVRAIVEREPDRSARAFTLGPRVLVSLESLRETGLIQPGSLIYHHYRLDWPQGMSAGEWREAVKERFPEAGWRIRDVSRAAPGLGRFIERVTLFMTLVGLTALLVGGVGIANAVRAYLAEKRPVIATLKTLGAPARLIFQSYLLEILILTAGGIALGLLLGAAAPFVAGPILAERLNVSAVAGLYPGALALAALYGLLTMLAFSLWPLAQAQNIRPAALFRAALEAGRRPPVWAMALVALFALLLAAVAILDADQKDFAVGFVVGAIASLALFRLAGWLVTRLAERAPRLRRASLRLAIANLHRPDSGTPSVVISLGLGLTVLVVIALIEANLTRQVSEVLPEEAPGFYFIDIQPNQLEAFTALARETEGVESVATVPMLRGRIVAVNGQNPEEMTIPGDVAWVFQGDRGITWSEQPVENSPVVRGDWWPADYRGEPLVSLDAEVGQALNLAPGDTLTVNLLGRNIEAEIANFREIEWSDLTINFVMVFSPGLISEAPQTHIATVKLDPAAEDRLENKVVAAFPNISAIRVKEALDSFAEILRNIATAVRSTAALTLIAGVLVLTGAFAAGQHRRAYDAVVLKVLGATRGEIAKSFLLQYSILGLVTAAIACVIGSLAAAVVVTEVMQADFVLILAAVVPTALIALAVTLILGFHGTWRALSVKAAPLLRNE